MSDAPYEIDLDAYFARIGYEGEADASWESLKALHLAHSLAVPFENLDVLIGRRISLDLADLERKIVTEERGGYCFEQNVLFRAVLEQLGFRTAPLLARVRWNVPPERITAQTHMAIFVECEGEAFMADVGFGGARLSAPLRLDTDEPQVTPHGVFRFTPRETILQLEFQTGAGERLPVYHLSLEPRAEIDLELSNWFTSTHPASHFIPNLVAARLKADGSRVALFNYDMTLRAPDGTSEHRTLLPAQVAGVLSNDFDLPFAWTPEVEAVLPNLPKPV